MRITFAIKTATPNKLAPMAAVTGTTENWIWLSRVWGPAAVVVVVVWDVEISIVELVVSPEL